MSQSQNAEKHSGFLGWYESYSGKKVVNTVYCLGASVVIVGALFKIMHFPGAGPMLMAGMITEAVLFAIGIFDKPHADFHWEEVFPQLMGYGADPKQLEELAKRPKPTLMGGGESAGSSNSSAMPQLSEKDMEALKGGINDLAKTAVQLSELGKLATVTNQLGEKMAVAGEAAGKFASSADILSKKSDELGSAYTTIVADMQGVVEGTKKVQQNVATMDAKIGSLNSVYEMQLAAVQAQSEKMKSASAALDTMSSDFQKMQTATADALKNQMAYEEGAKKLASQIADLNKIYGNMLTALA